MVKMEIHSRAALAAPASIASGDLDLDVLRDAPTVSLSQRRLLSGHPELPPGRRRRPRRIGLPVRLRRPPLRRRRPSRRRIEPHRGCWCLYLLDRESCELATSAPLRDAVARVRQVGNQTDQPKIVRSRAQHDDEDEQPAPLEEEPVRVARQPERLVAPPVNSDEPTIIARHFDSPPARCPKAYYDKGSVRTAKIGSQRPSMKPSVRNGSSPRAPAPQRQAVGPNLPVPDPTSRGASTTSHPPPRPGFRAGQA
jgi:hypothetical protein